MTELLPAPQAMEQRFDKPTTPITSARLLKPLRVQSELTPEVILYLKSLVPFSDNS